MAICIPPLFNNHNLIALTTGRMYPSTTCISCTCQPWASWPGRLVVGPRKIVIIPRETSPPPCASSMYDIYVQSCFFLFCAPSTTPFSIARFPLSPTATPRRMIPDSTTDADGDDWNRAPPRATRTHTEHSRRRCWGCLYINSRLVGH